MQKRIIIMGVPVDALTKSQVLDLIFSSTEGQKQIITVNPEMILAAQNDTEFMNILQHSAINTADGTGILWAADAQHTPLLAKIYKLIKLLFIKPTSPIPERIQGVDLFMSIMKNAEKNHNKIFLLGAKEGVAQKTKEQLEKQFPRIHIVGTLSGSPSPYEEEKIKDQINDTEPSLLFVAYGAPNQEKWIARNLHKMPTVKVAIGVGGTFDYVSGTIKRAPLFLQKIGLEWLYRLIREPKRWKRIWNAVVLFPYKLSLEKQTTKEK